MSEKQINIAIAEALGWLKFTQFTTYPKSWGGTPARYHTPIWSLTSSADMTEDECTKYGWHGDGHISIDHIPDYCNDLNAMHDAEKFLLGGWMRYCECLNCLLGKSVYASVHATARDRAEAFLKTIGKWEDAK